MTERRRRGSQEFADIVPGRTTEVYLDVTADRGVADRSQFLSQLASLAGGASAARPVSVVVFDLDDVPASSSGGDGARSLLHDVARLLGPAHGGAGRHFGRVGHESFAIVLADQPAASADSAVTTVQNLLRGLGLCASIGMATAGRSVTAEDLLASAEAAAKRSRREGGQGLSTP